MTNITLEEIKTEHAKVAEMIAAFEAKAKATTLTIDARAIEIPAGGFYAGTVLKDGKPDYDLVGVEGDYEAKTWQDAMDLAKSLGVEVPTLREHSLCRANAREHFKDAAYWSCEEHASGSDFAWFQLFYDGDQIHCNKFFKLRVRFVRRLKIY